MHTGATRKAPPDPYAGQETKIDLLFDSGAYSAWRLGKPVEFDAYCSYLLKNKSWMGTYIALDAIDPDSPERAAKVSLENYLAMKKLGLDPMPVFHAKEDFSWLHRMIDAGATYIGLAGLSLGNKNAADDWYAHCWDKLVDSSGKPLIKVHALGEGRGSALKAFPWYSADSTSWVYAAQRNAVIPVDGYRSISQRNDKLSQSREPDIDSLHEEDKLFFEAHLAKYGVSMDGLTARDRDATTLRTYLALQFYLEQERQVSACYPITYQRRGLLGGQVPKALQGAAPVELDGIKYYSVLGNNPCAWSCLTYAGATRGLISYFYVTGGHYNSLRDFIYDPVAVCSTKEPMKRAWETLKEHVNVA